MQQSTTPGILTAGANIGQNKKAASHQTAWIKFLLMPIFKDLQEDTFKDLQEDILLSRCLHGKTQNSNEALNGEIWSKVLKATFVSKDTIIMGVNSAVIHYNDGRKGLLDVLKYLMLNGSVAQ